MILYLDSLRSVRRKTLPGRLLSGMCLGKWRAHGDGYVPAILPNPHDLTAVMRGRITASEYRRRLEGLYQGWGEEMNRPQILSARDHADLGMVQDGDTIVCACPRPGPQRRHLFCHLEVAAPYMAGGVMEIRLYGQLVKP